MVGSFEICIHVNAKDFLDGLQVLKMLQKGRTDYKLYVCILYANDVILFITKLHKSVQTRSREILSCTATVKGEIRPKLFL